MTFINVIIPLHASAQKQLFNISGTVTDTQTNQPIPFVSIYFEGTTLGTISDTTGYFQLQSNAAHSAIRFQAIGYQSLLHTITEGQRKIEVQLKPSNIDINEIKVTPDNGPIKHLMQNVVQNKNLNNPDKLPRYNYEKYTKWEYGLNNVGEKLANSSFLKKHPDIYITATDSSRFLPVYFSEQIVHNEFQRNPLKQKSTIMADYTTGLGVLADYEISGYTSGLDIEVNFYHNFINLFTQNFVSPLADNGWFYYKYYLKDSIQINNNWQYQVRFVPRRMGDKAFIGEMTIDTQDFSLVQIDATLSHSGNINFLKNMRLSASFQRVTDTTTFYKHNLIEADIDYIPIQTSKDTNRLQVAFRQYSSINKVVIAPNDDVTLSSGKLSYESIKQNGAYNRDSSFWEAARHLPLSNRDRLLNAKIDSVNKIPAIKAVDKIGQMYMTGYIDLGKIEAGPYDYFFNFNEVEGTHLFLGARTSSEIWNNRMIWGGIGYGTRNNQWLGRLGMGHKLQTPTRRIIKIGWADDIVRIGENENILYLYENMLSPSESNLVSHLFKRDVLDELHRQQRLSATYDHEWRSGFSTRFSSQWHRHHSPEFYPFMQAGAPIQWVDMFEAGVNFRWSWREKYIDNSFLRVYYATDYPIIHLTLAGGQTKINQTTHPFARIHATFKYNVYMGQTYLKYAMEAGAYAGKLPYSMLNIPRGNETYGFYTYNYNMMNYLEFVHDKYIHTYVEHHWNGFFFNRVPLIKRLGLREVLSAKALWGGLNNRHYQLMDLPLSTIHNNKPFFEIGAGIENIFRFFRLDAVWRITPNSVFDEPAFGVRAQFQIKL
jgi:hypothetical protein